MKETTNCSGKAARTKNRDLFQEVTDRIMQSLEKGVAPWVKPWTPEGLDIPVSARGRYYRGINKVVLGMVQVDKEYSSNVWYTRSMAIAVGGWIGKGEKATRVFFFKPVEEPDRAETEDAGREELSCDSKEVPDDRKRRWYVRHYNVWNRDQIEGLPTVEKPKARPRTVHAPESFRHELAEQIVQGSGAEIEYGGALAFYSPQADRIRIPDSSLFSDPGSFHSTRFHELTHWTGHETRLDRGSGWHHATSEYAKEELVAEMGAAFFCDWCGIKGELQHPEYINSWLSILDKDKTAVVVAATLAQKAFDFVFEQAGMDAEGVPMDSIEERQIA